MGMWLAMGRGRGSERGRGRFITCNMMYENACSFLFLQCTVLVLDPPPTSYTMTQTRARAHARGWASVLSAKLGVVSL